MTELEKWNKFLAENYYRIKTHFNQTMFFQTFGDYNDDDMDEALTLIGEAVSRGCKIRYDKGEVWKLIFVTYKNICLQKIRKEKYNGGEYNDSILYNESDEEYTEIDTSIVDVMIEDIKKNFPPKYFDAVQDYMAGKLDKYNDKGLWMEVRNYLRWKYRKKEPEVRKKQPQPQIKKLYQYDRNGKLIAEYNSVRDCYEKTGLSQLIIRNYLKGKIDFAYSYHWTNEKIN